MSVSGQITSNIKKIQIHHTLLPTKCLNETRRVTQAPDFMDTINGITSDDALPGCILPWDWHFHDGYIVKDHYSEWVN